MIKNNNTLVNKKFNENLFNNYIKSNKKIFLYELNYNLGLSEYKPNLGNIQDINYENEYLDEEDERKYKKKK